MKTKACSICGKRKKLEAFYRKKCYRVRTNDCVFRIASQCKICSLAAQRLYYYANHEKCLRQARISGKRYYDTHQEQIKKYRVAHKERTKAYNKAYKATDPEKTRARAKAEREKHADCYKARRIKYRQAHGEEIRLRNRIYCATRGKERKRQLCDAHVRSILTKHSSILGNADIPQEFIELKREHIKLGCALKALA